ncbi:MAG: hypothetical protein HOC18_03490 [Candidatus Marinimicrobia bacterium]|nr:hypothetical protein [Candidatus Neomarinimicrobiota bacterium]
MPFYDFRCEECDKLVEDEFFKVADEKKIECCGIQMKQAFLKAPGLSDPGGIGQKWVNDGYQMKADDAAPRIVTEKWEKGKNVIRSDVHDSDKDIKKNWNENIEYVPKEMKESPSNSHYFNPNHPASKWYKQHKKSRKFVPNSKEKQND